MPENVGGGEELIAVPALRVRQWLPEWERVQWNSERRQARPERDHFYMFSLSAAVLKRLTGIQRRAVATGQPRSEDVGIQRFHDRSRSDEIAQFVTYGYPWSDLSQAKRESEDFADLRKPGWLPTAIIVNIPRAGAERRGARLSPEDALEIVDLDGSSLAKLLLPSGVSDATWQPSGLHPIEVIDGQHRLWAFDQQGDPNFEVPVVAFFDLDISWQAYLFWTINIKPKRINASLAFDLYPLLRSEDWLDKFFGHPIYRETRAQELVEALWSHEESPWFRRINMLGTSSSQSGDTRPMATQNAWVKSLMATYVKAWEGPGTRIGGLFGDAAQGAASLPWTRTQQAAFLILVWKKMLEAVQRSSAEWAVILRNPEQQQFIEEDRSDLAFYGKHSLFTSDPGIRAVLFASNDICFMCERTLRLAEWDASDAANGSDPGAISAALESLVAHPVSGLLGDMAEALAEYDWRTSAAPGLSDIERRSKQALRGSGGYRTLRADLMNHLATRDGLLGQAARGVITAVGF